MTRAANGAQRSGAAALPFIFARQREDLTLPRDCFATSSFVPRTPARWLRQRLWLRSGRRSFPGSVVLIGSGGRTANRLKSIGSTVLFYEASRDARTCTAARAYTRTCQNHRTIEPTSENDRNLPFLTAKPVLSRFCGSGANKEWGGYSLLAIAASSRPDQGLDGGSARRNFRAPNAVASVAGRPIGADIEQLDAAGKNDGFPPFSGARMAPVGMAVLERQANVAPDQCLATSRRKPARLAGRSAGAAWTPRGSIGLAGGGTPPTAARSSLRSLAQPSFSGSAALQIRCDAAVLWDRHRRLISSVQMGSGVVDLSLAEPAMRGCAAKCERQQWVGGQTTVLSWGRSRKDATVWGGPAHVN